MRRVLTESWDAGLRSVLAVMVCLSLGFAVSGCRVLEEALFDDVKYFKQEALGMSRIERPFEVVYTELVDVVSEPAGLTVWVDGEPAGVTPVRVELVWPEVTGRVGGVGQRRQVWLVRATYREDARGEEVLVSSRRVELLESSPLAYGNRWAVAEVEQTRPAKRVVELRDNEQVLERWERKPSGGEGEAFEAAMRSVGYFQPLEEHWMTEPGAEISGRVKLRHPPDAKSGGER